MASKPARRRGASVDFEPLDPVGVFADFGSSEPVGASGDFECSRTYRATVCRWIPSSRAMRLNDLPCSRKAKIDLIFDILS